MEAGSGLTEPERRRAARHHLFWRFVNPTTRPFAGFAPWWVLLETTGHRTGEQRRTPLARGPVEGDVVWLNSVHGKRASWVRNIEVTPAVRIKLSGRWYEGCATVYDWDERIDARFNAYARSGPRTLGIDPALVRIDLER